MKIYGFLSAVSKEKTLTLGYMYKPSRKTPAAYSGLKATPKKHCSRETSAQDSPPHPLDVLLHALCLGLPWWLRQ